MLCYLAGGQIEPNAESNLPALYYYSFLHNWPGIRFDWYRWFLEKYCRQQSVRDLQEQSLPEGRWDPQVQAVLE